MDSRKGEICRGYGQLQGQHMEPTGLLVVLEDLLVEHAELIGDTALTQGKLIEDLEGITLKPEGIIKGGDDDN